MNVSIKENFANAQKFSRDVYVADYTNQTNSVRKLEFLENPPNDITYFRLSNRQNIEIYGVNFEAYPAYVAGNPMCECLFTPVNANGKPWVMLMEMKYCEYRNVNSNAMDAFLKLKHSYTYLHGSKNLINPSQHKIYLVVSIPNHSELEPFNSFRSTQNDVIESYDNLGIVVFAKNNILVATPNYLFEIKSNIHK